MDTLAAHTGWEGDLHELAGLMSKLDVGGGNKGTSAPCHPRVIRDYVRRGILRRPQRRGKAAFYNYRSILELVAARALVADGWPLVKIAEHLNGMNEPELKSLVDGRANPSNALSLARSFLAAAGKDTASAPNVGPVEMHAPSLKDATTSEIFRDKINRASEMRKAAKHAAKRLTPIIHEAV